MDLTAQYYAHLLGFSTSAIPSFFDWKGGVEKDVSGKVTALLDTQGRRTATYNGSATNKVTEAGGILQLRGGGGSSDTSTSFTLQQANFRSAIFLIRSFKPDAVNMLTGGRLTSGIAAGAQVDSFIREPEISLDGNAGGGAAYDLRLNGAPLAVTPGSNGNYLGSFAGPMILQFNYTMEVASQLEYLFRRWNSGFSPWADIERFTLSSTLWTQTDIQKLEGVYAHDAGTPSELANNHPYKSNRP
ncbi:hypothetical protein [uncultured Pontibacter sp.]|uniref:hypothetical protein n=1 Tax=uncultured Pontibacter sp. TaxID=453356 RepID=UPI00262550DE|nr:hypothetical protein [uncultured Pontibacter sp.]